MTDQGSPTPTTSPEEDDLADLPGFGQIPTTRAPDPLPPGATTTTTGPEEGYQPWRASLGLEGGDDELDQLANRRPRADGPSSPASTERVDPAELAPLAAALVGMVSMLVRFIRTRRRALPDGVWIADEEDQIAIGAPLASLAARHSPITGDGAGDTVDGLALVVGTANYAVKNLNAEADAGDDQLGPVDGTYDPDDAG